MNSGAASSGKELIDWASFCGHDVGGHAGEPDERDGGEAECGVERHAEKNGDEPDAHDLEHGRGHRGMPPAGRSGSPRSVRAMARADWQTTAKPAIGTGM